LKLLLLEPIDEEARELLEANGVECTMNSNDGFENIDGLFTKLEPIAYEDLGLWNKAKFIATPCTGTDHINVPDNVKLIYLDQEFKDTVGQEITATAEHTWALLLSLIRKIPFAHNQTDRYKFTGTELRGKTIGIIGYGRIGQQIAKYAKAFGMTVIIHDQHQCLLAWGRGEDGSNFKHGRELLEESDIITLHVPLNDETKGMIGDYEFEIMKDGAVLINTSRGDIVQTLAIIDALCDEKIGGYATDFYNDGLYRLVGGLDNFIMTPHIAGNCVESRKATDLYIAKQIIKYKEENSGI
jgi:D-3-phosphoglycerate dehydrogenase